MENRETVAAAVQWYEANLYEIHTRMARWSRRFGRYAEEWYAEARGLLWKDAIRKAELGQLDSIGVGLMVGWAQRGTLYGRSVRKPVLSKSELADREHELTTTERLDRLGHSREPNPAEAFRRKEDWKDLMGRLNERERRVAHLLRDGWRTKDIAAELLVTPGRVSQIKTRLADVLTAMGYKG